MATQKSTQLEYSPQLVEKYVKIRDALAAAKEAFDAETARMKAALGKIEAVFEKQLLDSGAESIKTEHGTFYTKTRSSASLSDREAFYKFAVDTDNLYAVDMKANAKAVRELLEQGIEVPGVNYSESKVVNVRRK